MPALAPAFSLADEAVSDRGHAQVVAGGGRRHESRDGADGVSRPCHGLCVEPGGCAMGCGFCATGQAGYFRQLSSGEIIEQVVRAARYALDHRWGRLGNIVFMGMGEPLANYPNVRSAIGR